jgi:hypothetical protein
MTFYRAAPVIKVPAAHFHPNITIAAGCASAFVGRQVAD